MQYPIIHHSGDAQITIVGSKPSLTHPQNTAVPLSVRGAAQRGWQIFPIHTHSNHATIAAATIARATNDLVQLEEWANQHSVCGWSVATGHASGVLAVEMKGAEGIAAFTFLVLDNQYDELMQHALISQTGYGGAETIYVYFRWPADFDMCHHLRGTIAPGLRLRGEGDYALLPTHISGMSHNWLDADLLVAPQWLLDSQITASERQVTEMPLRFPASPSRKTLSGAFPDGLSLAKILPFVTHTSSVSGPNIQHRVYMSFHHWGDRWRCRFFAEEDLKTPLPRSLSLTTAEEVVALVARGGGLLNPEIRQALDQAVATEQGGVFLNLTTDQYAQLQKHPRPKARA
jgi:hypothetical protein